MAALLSLLGISLCESCKPRDSSTATDILDLARFQEDEDRRQELVKSYEASQRKQQAEIRRRARSRLAELRAQEEKGSEPSTEADLSAENSRPRKVILEGTAFEEEEVIAAPPGWSNITQPARSGGA
eukprot:gb/GFBE01069076.1/.p1 GENE.gb/GFBE01069076.1/~~gb/GFBE01069076.1/.p1  ORF type:complete len:127 (+),score=29.52 gb/GFBE01069076.1/:1-381(+)